MTRCLQWALVAAGMTVAQVASAQYYLPAPVVVYRPPVVVAPVPAYYSYYPPTVASYYPPTVAYAPPIATASYYAPVTAYSPGVSGIVTTQTYRGFGIFRPWGWNSTSYFTPTGVTYTPGVTAYYGPVYP